ncbi:MAG: hypothetical protein LBK62_02965 [Treponema sp.]|jgi:hypothetical protein|nr:hypothetical protein [Treponema sp.]
MSNVAKYALDNPNAIKDMCKDVRKVIKKAATQTVNAVAFEARKNLKSRVQEEFINRNSFTTSGNALFVTKAAFGHTENLGDIHASVGFSEKAVYMRRQDEGGEHEGPPGNNLAIPTDAARKGETKTGLVKTQYHMDELPGAKVRGTFKKKYRLAVGGIWNGKREKGSKGVAGMPKAAGVARAFVAAREGKLIHYQENLFAVTNFVKEKDIWDKNRQERIFGKVSFEIHPIYIFDRPSTHTPARHFFMPECEKAAARIQDLFNENMDKAQGGH